MRSLVLKGKSLCIFAPTNCLRRFLSKITESKAFGVVIMLCIFVSTVTLALEEPLEDPKSKKREIMGYIDVATTSIFTVEAVLKIIVFGFYFNKKQSYLKDAWNVLDFIIVVSGIITLTSSSDIGFFKVLRILRVLRPLRLIKRIKGLKLVIQTLFLALPRIINLQLVVLFFMYTFAILLTTLFSGMAHHCKFDHLPLSISQKEELIVTKFDCINYGGEWEPNEALNFDNTLHSMLLIFILQSGNRMEDFYLTMIDAVGVDMQPVRHVNYFFAFLHTVLILMFTVLFFNMFVGVVIEVYKKE